MHQTCKILDFIKLPFPEWLGVGINNTAHFIKPIPKPLPRPPKKGKPLCSCFEKVFRGVNNYRGLIGPY